VKKTLLTLITLAWAVLAGLFAAPRALYAGIALFDDDVFVDTDHLPLEEDY